uniref:Platelet endothelial cell adhesion molecule n=1 Tax=Fundulus heteroclitus TaxID=8078 RepID=A0A3Q2SRU9_FUNHE
MGLLLLLTSTLLFSSFHSGTALNADLKITSVDLSVEPSDEVSRGTNVTLRCKGKVLTSRMDALIRVYTISKDDVVIYNKTTSSSEDFLYHLPEARVSNNGKYRCRMHMMGEEMGSQAVRLSVTGMSTPILQLSKAIVTEGEAVNATCLAPGETGSILFNFYDGSKDIDKMGQSSNPVMFRPKGVGDHVIRCSYSVFVMPDKFSSPQSNAVNLTVKELSVGPVLTISPQDNVYEGDALKITCSVNDSMKDYPDALLLLSQGDTLLNSGNTFVHANWIVQATGPELNVVCRLYVRSAEKVAMKTVSVTELFSVPILQMSPSEVFQGDSIRLTCTSRILSYDKLGGEPLIYRLESLTDNMTQANGIFVFKAKKIDFNYTCTVVAKGIKKKSNVLAINPKVGMAKWKKLLISGTVILVVSSLVMMGCVLFIRSRRGERKPSAELSVKPASPKSDDSLTVTLTHGTEVYNAATGRVQREPVSVWSSRKPETGSDDEISTASNDPEVEYTEVVHPRSEDPTRSPLRKGTDTVYSELQNSLQGAADHHDYGSAKYMDQNGDQQHDITQHNAEANNYSDLPIPVD